MTDTTIDTNADYVTVKFLGALASGKSLLMQLLIKAVSGDERYDWQIVCVSPSSALNEHEIVVRLTYKNENNSFNH